LICLQGKIYSFITNDLKNWITSDNFSQPILHRILDFGFRCGSPTNKDGLSVPLLSVSIAGLMAIFLDAKFASQISVKSLTAVIYYSTAALLDKRLSATATPESYGLDSSTSKKMVKAINKVRIYLLVALSFTTW
jgi:hypothetical protein